MQIMVLAIAMVFGGMAHAASCTPDFDGNDVVDRMDIKEKRNAMNQEFQTWKTECWSPKADCGDYNDDGKVDRNDSVGKNRELNQAFQTWKRTCWLAGMTAATSGPKTEVSECGGFDMEKIGFTTRVSKETRKDENLVWKYDSTSQTATLINQNVWLNCCGDRSVDVSLNDETGVYEIRETDKAEEEDGVPLRCRCQCFFDFKVSLPDMDADIISVKLFRTITDQENPDTVAWEGELDLREGEGEMAIAEQSAFVSADDAGNDWKYMAAPEVTGLDDGAEDDTIGGNDVAREIEEADIIKIDGTTMYLLNQYRGLFVCDIAQPDNPRIAGRADVSGKPVEMYIRDNLAYIIVSDVSQPIYGIMEDGSATPDVSVPGSRVDIVDVSNMADPKITGSFDVEGIVTESRIVGDILYVVSSEQSFYYPIFMAEKPMLLDVEGTDTAIAPDDQTSDQSICVASINIADPSDIQEVDREDFEGSAEYIHVTEDTIFISSTAGYRWDNPTTTLIYVDISDPTGIIAQRGALDVRGRIEDKFKMDYANGYFRVCTYEWNEGGLSYLFVIDVSDPDNMSQVGSVQLAKGEQLFATRFDGDRAYMVTYERKDPLWVIDLSDPTQPSIKGELIVPGWSTHIEPRGDRLIALGVDDTDGWKVAVSLFDVSDAEKPSLIKRVSFGDENGWSSSSAYGDVKAFTVMDDMNMILLPYTFSSHADGKYRTESRLQLIDYSDTNLAVRGWVSQKGSVLRSRSFQDRLFSVSDNEIQVINAANRDKPVVTASLTLLENIVDFMPLENGYGVQMIMDSDGEYVLKAVPLSDPDTSDAAGQITLDMPGYYSAMLSNGNLVYVVTNRYEYEEKPEDSETGWYYNPGRNLSRVQVIDFSSPSAPQKRGYADVEGNYYAPMPLLGGTVISPYYTSGQIIQMKGDVLVFPRMEYHYYRPIYIDYDEVDDKTDMADSDSEDGDKPLEPGDDEKPPVEPVDERPDPTDEDPEPVDEKPEPIDEKPEEPEWTNELIVMDLSNPDAPAVTAEFPLDIRETSGYFAKGDVLHFSYKESLETGDDADRGQALYYLGGVNLADMSAPTLLTPVNIPGMCIGMDDTGTYAYTTDTEWGFWKDDPQVYSFNVVRIESDTAFLTDKVELENSFYNFVIADGLAYLSGSGYWWGGYSGNLTIIDLADPENLSVHKNESLGSGFNIFAAKGRKVFARVSGGIGCYDSSNPESLELEEFKTGWYNRIAFSDDAAYLPLGYYGLWKKDL